MSQKPWIHVRIWRYRTWPVQQVSVNELIHLFQPEIILVWFLLFFGEMFLDIWHIYVVESADVYFFHPFHKVNKIHVKLVTMYWISICLGQNISVTFFKASFNLGPFRNFFLSFFCISHNKELIFFANLCLKYPDKTDRILGGRLSVNS